MTWGPLTIAIPGAPRGKGRPRFSRAAGVAFTDAKTRNTEAFIRLLATQEMAALGLAPLDEAVTMAVRAVFEPPKSWSRKKRDAALRGEVLPTGRPDLDNILKACLDALNGIAFRDDSLVTGMDVTKAYGPQALTVVTVRSTVPEGMP